MEGEERKGREKLKKRNVDVEEERNGRRGEEKKREVDGERKSMERGKKEGSIRR